MKIREKRVVSDLFFFLLLVFIVSSLASLSLMTIVIFEISFTCYGTILTTAVLPYKDKAYQKRETTMKASEEATSSQISVDKWIKL